MAAQKGFIYENNAYKILKQYGIAAGAPPAGAAHDRPDLEIKSSSEKENKKQGCELKITATAAGSLVMKYTDGLWGFAPIKDSDVEKKMMMEIAKKHKLLENMNTSGAAGARWRGKMPHLQNNKDGSKVYVGVKKGDKRAAYAKDIKLFGGQNEVKIPLSGKAISDYYNTKKTYYINVGTHGFYLMNKKDPLNLNRNISGGLKIPDFSDVAKAQIRVRCQSKGGGTYQFAMTLTFTSVKKSPYNLAPTRSASNVEIDIRHLESDKNAPLLEAFL